LLPLGLVEDAEVATKPRGIQALGSLMNTVRIFTSDDAKRRLLIFKRENGFFSFMEEFEDTEDMTEYGMGIDTFWVTGCESGLYGNVEDAERDARAVIPWLRDNHRFEECD
jgi:hypothetical protein